MKQFIVLSALAIFGFAIFSSCSTVKEPKVIVLDKFIILEDAHFKFDTDTLTRKGERAMMHNIKVLNDNPGVKVRIAGYSSASGTDEYNQKLSERRANTVREILIAGNIAPERLKVFAYGDTKSAKYEPVPKNIESKQAKANMRVIFEVIVQ